MFLGGTGAGCVLACCSTAVWLTYEVGGMAGCCTCGDGVCSELLLECTDPCGADCPHGRDPLLLDNCDPVESFVVLSRGLKSNQS